MAMSDVLWVINDTLYLLLELDEETVQKLKEDKPYADTYIRHAANTGILSSEGLSPTTVIHKITVFKNTDEEYSIEYTNYSEEHGVEKLPDDSPTNVQTDGVNDGTAEALNSTNGPNTSFIWTTAATTLLINIRHEMAGLFESAKRKKFLWDKLAKQMFEVGKYSLSGKICSDKFKNIMSTYRTNKDKMNTSGEGSVKWEFFLLLDDLFGKKASSEPQPNQIQRSVLNLISLPSCSSSESFSPAPSTSSTPTPTKRKSMEDEKLFSAATKCQPPPPKKMKQEPPSWFLEYLQEKKKEDREREGKYLETFEKLREVEEAKLDLLRNYLNKSEK